MDKNIGPAVRTERKMLFLQEGRSFFQRQNFLPNPAGLSWKELATQSLSCSAGLSEVMWINGQTIGFICFAYPSLPCLIVFLQLYLHINIFMFYVYPVHYCIFLMFFVYVIRARKTIQQTKTFWQKIVVWKKIKIVSDGLNCSTE